MSDLKGTEFVKALLAQEPLLEDAEFQRHRAKLLERLTAAERRERRGRRIVITASLSALVVLSCVFGLPFLDTERSEHWPDWLKYLLAMAVILFPCCAMLLGGIYFLRHWRELQRTRSQVYRSALLDLPRQIEHLRRELADLRDEVSRKDRAFTLTELLVTIAVLGILAALLFPALAQAKDKARGIRCLGNLSQIGKALIMYESQEGAYPGAGSPVKKINSLWTRTEDSWDGRLLPLLSKNTNLFVCPSVRTRTWGPSVKEDAYGYNAGGTCGFHEFARNLGLGFGLLRIDGIDVEGPVVRSGEVMSPAEMLAVADLQMPRGLWINTITPNVLPQEFGGMKSAVAGRHRGGANVLFCDGHVEFGKLDRWNAPNEAARRRWNNDHEPHPETWR